MSDILRRLLVRLAEACYRPGRLGSLIGRSVRKLEGGTMRSAAWRRILLEHHRVQVGPMSYGECIDAAALHPGTVIGAFTSIGYGVRFVRRNHPWRNLSTHPAFYADSLGWVEGSEVDRDELNPLIIGHDVWIGYNALILPGCTKIGTGAVVGAGAVVTRDVPPYAIVVGNPAVVRRWRFDEVTRERLLSSSWWMSSEEDLRRIADRVLRGELPVVG